MTDITLDFIGKQLEAIQNEQRTSRDQFADFKDVLTIQSTIIRRLDATVEGLTAEIRAMHSRVDRLDRRLHKLEESA